MARAILELRRHLLALEGGADGPSGPSGLDRPDGAGLGLGAGAGALAALDAVEAEAAAKQRQLLELSTRAAEVEARARRKDAVAATVGHELRNPLSVIATGLEVLRTQPSTAPLLAGDRTLRIVRDQVRHMMRLLDDLLQTRREAAIELLSLVPVAVGGLVEQAVLAVEERVRSRGQVLTVELPAEEVRVRVDRERVGQVLVNLLDNASKYTADGGRLGLVVHADPRICVLRVWDEGIGIAGIEVERIQAMFTQGRGLPGRESSGMGIGLGLAGRIVELHGGKLEVVSRDQGRPLGTEVVVRLRRELAPSVRRPPTAPQRVARTAQRILVVDGNGEHAALVAQLLAARGHATRTAERGLQALELSASFLPQVVIVDAELPTMHGSELARRIRELLPSTRIVGVSGFPPDAERTAGFDGYAMKPVGPATLDELLGERDG